MTYEEVKAFIRDHRTLRDFYHAHRVVEDLAQQGRTASRRHVKVAVLASYTTDFVLPLLKTELTLSDIDCEVYKPGFNQFRQEILNRESGLYSFDPDVTIVGFGLEDILPDAVSKFPLLSHAECEALKQEVLGMCEGLLQAYRSFTARGSILLQDVATPWFAYQPLVDNENGLRSFLTDLNTRLRELAARHSGTYVMDYSRLVADCGARHWTDPRLYYTARIPVAQQHWIPLAVTYARYIGAAMNQEIKCIVLDLDNTLWSGVLGEDGFDGIAIGESYPGNTFRRFQEYLLALYVNGYILAICSKNDQDDVLDVLRRHPSMVLREEHFASIKANWKSKVENLRDISSEIQISPDHMLFVDDNVVEIENVRAGVPGISCLHLQSPPLNFLVQMEDARCIGKLLLTDEDRSRGQQYSDDRKRRELRVQLGSIDGFYRSLEQRMTIYVNYEPHRARIAQLTQRTNQFNMTTIRLSESDVQRMFHSPDYMLVTADLEDRFGSSGTMAFIQIRKFQRSWVIENFLMSCRVLGRTIEERLIDYVVEAARTAGAESVLATYVPTKKNVPFENFYGNNQFTEIETGPSREKRYVCALSSSRPRPSFVEIKLGG